MVRINSWAASHEEKWRDVSKKLKEKIEGHNKTVKNVLQIQMMMDGGEVKKMKNVVLLRIINFRKIKRM